MHYRADGRATTQTRPRRKMHDFGDLGRALEMVALLPGVALGGQGEDFTAVNGSCEMTRPRRIDRSRFGSLHLVHSQCRVLDRAFLTALRAFLLLAGRRYELRIDTNID